MQATLVVTTGSSLAKKFVVPIGATMKIGRVQQAEIRILDDAMMSNLHFAITCTDDGCKLRDLGSRFGTTVNGKPVIETTLTQGYSIVAGRTTFRVHIAEGVGSPKEAAAPPVAEARQVTPVMVPTDAPPIAREWSLVKILSSQSDPLFALLDGGSDPRVVDLLRQLGEEFQSLHEPTGEDTTPFASPYLVRLPKGSLLLETLARDAWGESWGVYLTSQQSFADLRGHLRRLLQLKSEEGQTLYFRFYDPRILRSILPTCTPAQADEIFGPIVLFLIESANPEMLLRFTNTGRGSKSQAVYINRADG